jgi:hypothetical protein
MAYRVHVGEAKVLPFSQKTYLGIVGTMGFSNTFAIVLLFPGLLHIGSLEPAVLGI